MNEAEFNSYFANLKKRYTVSDFKLYNETEDGIKIVLIYSNNKHIGTYVPTKSMLYTELRV